MTLVSRPVLAAQCTTPSGYVSLNASTAGRGVTCAGRRPSYWSTSQSYGDWTPPYFPTTVGGPGGHQATRFDDVFAPHYSGKTLLQVVSLQGLGMDPANPVAQLIVAALLNAAKGWTPVLTVQAVKGIWSEYITTGAFSPSSGASWNASEIIEYVLTTTES
ncbi:MAG TPA: hypothetical protein VGQ19_03785 [Burkholderiales bacterium]|jgi:hypothetical protein|nr:hypothetical protein [Burkholderiales bacterium]